LRIDTTEIFFGIGSFEKFFDVFSDSLGKILVITTSKRLQHEFLSRIHSRTITINSELTPDPELNAIKSLISSYQHWNPDTIIGFGGGSSIDAAKIVSFFLNNAQFNINKCWGNGIKLDGIRRKKLIAIPTTAGTGSELSKGAIVTDAGVKGGFRGNSLVPDIAVVDPLLTLTLKRERTAIVGFDVFAHAFETYISRFANDLTISFSLSAIRSVTDILPRLLDQLDSIELRSSMSFYSMLMGYNLANASTCLPHRLQYTLFKEMKIPHALGVAFFYKAWLRNIVLVNEGRKKMELLANFMNYTEVNHLIGFFYEFIDSIGILGFFSQLGLSKLRAESIINNVSGNLKADPSYKNRDTIAHLVHESIDSLKGGKK